MKTRLASAGIGPVGSAPDRLRQALLSDITKYAKIVKDAKMNVEH
jgi:hypothetical protein